MSGYVTVEGRELVGLVPAAGLGTRISPLPCSKEVFPVGFRRDQRDGVPRPKAAMHHLLEKMRRAGARKALVVLRDGKWDIPGYFGNGELLDLDLAYVVMRRPYGVPFSVDDAYAFLRGKDVLFGFPDILFRPADVFDRIRDRKTETGADAMVAVVPVQRTDKTDMVELDREGRIVEWDTRPGVASFDYTWLCAAWGPGFTEFLHGFVAAETPAVEAAGGAWQGREMSMGDVLWRAVQDDLHVEGVLVKDGIYVDIGTPDDLLLAVREYADGGGTTTESA